MSDLVDKKCGSCYRLLFSDVDYSRCKQCHSVCCDDCLNAALKIVTGASWCLRCHNLKLHNVDHRLNIRAFLKNWGILPADVHRMMSSTKCADIFSEDVLDILSCTSPWTAIACNPEDCKTMYIHIHSTVSYTILREDGTRAVRSKTLTSSVLTRIPVGRACKKQSLYAK